MTDEAAENVGQSIAKDQGWSKSSSVIGDASSAIILLRDYSKFGLAERVFYHLDLTEALPETEPSLSESSPLLHRELSGNESEQDAVGAGAFFCDSKRVCGVYRLLECAPMALWHRLNRRQKRTLRSEVRAFNSAAESVHGAADILCYQPQHLPLRLGPSARVFFGYEVTRIAFCVDASASLTSTFGTMGIGSKTGGPLCPLDRLPEMARLFFASLVEPISSASLSEPWSPRLAVTVLAVYPMGETSETDLLVRDFHVKDAETAKVLTDQMEAWVHSDVEFGISERLCRRQPGNTWSIPIYSSNLRHILEAGDYALDVLSSEARPVIVVATDGRSVSCDGIVDVFLEVDRVDIPVHILDLSLPETHSMDGATADEDLLPSRDEMNFLTYDPGGPLGFPLYLTDDTESLFVVCRATGGCFLDFHLLSEATKNTAGHQPATDIPSQPTHSFRRRFVKMNGLQWLTLFSLSPISPTFHASWGKLVPPFYLMKQLTRSMTENPSPAIPAVPDGLDISRHPSIRAVSENSRSGRSEGFAASTSRRQHPHARTTFSTYVVSPVRIKALLLTRIKEGYRTKQYGLSTHDPGKVFIQFSLPVEFGIILHYELSYKALSSENHMVGSAHIKIEMSGDPNFVQLVKNDFLRQSVQTAEGRLFSVLQKKSARLCQVFRWTRREDILQSNLKPPYKWSDQLSSPDSPFVKRLATLTNIQRKRHFQTDEFDVVCSGSVQYGADNVFLCDFQSNDDGTQEMVDAITKWSSQAMKSGSKYVKRCSPNLDHLTNYCVVEILGSSKASQLFTISIEFFGGIGPVERLEVLSSLKKMIDSLKHVEVLSKQMAPFLIGDTKRSLVKYQNTEIQVHHASWDLLKDPELLSLLTRRRIEIGGFRLLQSSDNHALFAKLVPEDSASPGDLVQYQIAVRDEQVDIDLHMESESGAFNPYREATGETTQFGKMASIIRRRDQECGRALSSRTNLLNVFDTNTDGILNKEDHRTSVKRMLAYSSRVSRKLRFFRSSDGLANKILFQLTSDLLLTKGFGGAKVARLDIDPNDRIHGEDSGVWLVIRYDRLTMSIAHLSIVDKDEDINGQNQVYRELTFFTTGISDLYSKRDDLADDDSAESHISEYLCVSEFADHFEVAQKKLFSLAAYLALSQADSTWSIDQEDFKEVMRSLNFLEVSSVIVVGGPSDNDDESTLLRSIKTVLRPVLDAPTIFFYSGGLRMGSRSIDDHESLGSSEGNESEASSETDGDASNMDDHGYQEDELEAVAEIKGRSADNDETLTPPLFVRFKLDGVVASLQDLNQSFKSSNLSVEISVFKRTEGSSRRARTQHSLTWTQQAFAVEITSLLKSYVAEQTLERLRDADTSEDMLLMVKKCLARIRSVVTFSIDVLFYISKRDAMVPASAPGGGEVEVEEGYHILDGELRNNGSVALKALSAGGYFVSSMSGEEKPVEFWCLLTIQRSLGKISSQTYHPGGEAVAMAVMSRIQDVLRSCIHRVNQQLLLKSMHRNRSASALLIPKQSQQVEESTSGYLNESSELFVPGIFGCPVVFRTSFELYHRAATNPGQVARTLESTVLHNFAVSNRSGIFVYKDETEAIFYMKIEPIGTGIDADGQVELLVFGVHEPGPSVTKQLRVLLLRRLLLIGVDMLSSVLTKNPHFKWKQADFDFLRAFDREWHMLEHGKAEKQDMQIYEFPADVTDPCMVLLMFRQNLCGSTFFHRLNDIDQSGSNPSPAISESAPLPDGGSTLKMNRHEFTLYYNNAPSKLDPRFQGLSTLTEKGADFCRQAGMGIAMIEFGLVYSDGHFVDEVNFAVPACQVDGVEAVPLENLRMKKRSDCLMTDTNNPICVRFKITDTALQGAALHEWILLTLNQALVEWVAERLVERSFYKLLRPITGLYSRRPKAVKYDSKREILVDGLCPGLPALKSVLDSAFTLPHPAITKADYSGVVRSSSVATLTLSLLQKCVLAPLSERNLSFMTVEEAKETSFLSQHRARNLKIIRISRSERPRLVELKWGADRRNAVVSALAENGATVQIKDSPIDCPEYICYYMLTELDSDAEGIDAQLRLYKEVVVDDGISEKSRSIDLLQSIKRSNPKAFLHSFAFVFSIKRDKRCLWTYNWNPLVVKSVLTLLREADAANLANAGRVSHSLQQRSLQTLSPGLIEAKAEKRVKIYAQMPPRQAEARPKAMEQEGKQESSGETGPIRRIRRPTMIRRPKLVGQSIEGAAMQAVAASRKRASTNQFKNKTSSFSPQPTRQQIASDSTLPRPKIVSNADSGSNRNLSKTIRSLDKIAGKDDTLTRVQDDYGRLCNMDYGQMRRLSSLQGEGRLRLINMWWPRNLTQSIPMSVAKYLVSLTPKGWTDVCSFPPLPGGVEHLFIPTIARWIVALTPGLELLPLSSTSNPNVTGTSSLFLCSNIRNVRGSKCFAVVKITSFNEKHSQLRVPFVRCEGWVLNLPRRSRGAQKAKPHAAVTTTLTLERDSAGMDKMLSDVHRSLVLESLLFDFSASMVERAVRLLDGRIKVEDLVPTIQELMKRYPYERQKRMPMLNYRAFSATIVLKSYRNRLIDLYDATALFQRLELEADARELLRCGNSLCFKKSIVSVKGSHSICFLTKHPTDEDRMQLAILCRTQGRNLADFMFREGSNVAVHILDNIAIEAGGLALKELHYAAESLLKDSLWKSFSSRRANTESSSSLSLIDDLQEMLRLTHVYPLLQLRSNGGNAGTLPEEVQFLFGTDSGIEWKTCCTVLKRIQSLSPSRSIDNVGMTHNLFYIRKYDVFLMLVVDQHTSLLLRAEVIEKDKTVGKHLLVFDMVVNLILHYVWHSL